MGRERQERVGLPLHKFLGAVETGTVASYTSGGYYVEGKTAKMVGDEMASSATISR